MKKNIYLDFAASTPVDPRALKAMSPYFFEKFGNSMSFHTAGQEAKKTLENSRKIIAGIINAAVSEIIFTGSATESNNLALKGIAFANHKKGNHILISSIEHPCVREAAGWLARNSFEVEKIKVDKFGLVNPEEISNKIRKNTILVSIIHGSNEIGTIQPVEKIGLICRGKKVFFHTDASQTFGKIKIDVRKMNIDLLTASSHKIYGPKGAAFLYFRKGVRIEPILHGGGQESGFRGSTVNIPAIVGFSKAGEISSAILKKESVRLIKLRDFLIEETLKIPGSHLTGHPSKRVPHIASFWFEGVEGEALLLELDMAGIMASTGSACSSMKLEPSEVLLAIGLEHAQAHGSLRLSIGRTTTEKEIKAVLVVLPRAVARMRSISGYEQLQKSEIRMTKPK